MSNGVRDRGCSLCQRPVQRFEFDVMKSKKAFILGQAIQQLSFGKSSTALAWSYRGRNAVCIGLDAIDAGELALVTLDFALLTSHTCEHPGRFHIGS